MRLKRSDLVDQYEKILTTSPNIDIFDIDIEVSKQAAQLRVEYNLKTPDSIQLATATVNNAKVFLTNDADFKRVTGLEVLTLENN